MINSYLYYEKDSPVVGDDTWQDWAEELARMPHEDIGYYDEMFKDWDGTTGNHLTYSEELIEDADNFYLNMIELKNFLDVG